MDRATAEKLMAELVKSHKALDLAEAAAREIKSAKERKKFIEAILAAGGTLYTDTMFRIIMQYPDLNPYPKEKK